MEGEKWEMKGILKIDKRNCRVGGKRQEKRGGQEWEEIGAFKIVDVSAQRALMAVSDLQKVERSVKIILLGLGGGDDNILGVFESSALKRKLENEQDSEQRLKKKERRGWDGKDRTKEEDNNRMKQET